MATQEQSETLKRISIPGRMALAAVCFEIACEHLGVSEPVIFDVIAYFWRFTTSTSLDVWEGELPEPALAISQLMGSRLWQIAILDEKNREMLLDTGAEYLRTARKQKGLSHQKQLLVGRASELLKLPLLVLVMIETIWQGIGCGNFYAGTDDYSEVTHSATIRALDCLEVLGIPPPDQAVFQQFRFGSGWGTATGVQPTRSYLRERLNLTQR